MKTRTCVLALSFALLAGPGLADSIESQHGAELITCEKEADRAERWGGKTWIEANYDCLYTNGWLPGSGKPTVLDRATVKTLNAIWEERGARADDQAKCKAETGYTYDNDWDNAELLKRMKAYYACQAREAESRRK